MRLSFVVWVVPLFLCLYGCNLSIKPTHSTDPNSNVSTAPTPDPLFSGNIGYWKFDDASGSTSIADSSSQSNVGTVVTGGGLTLGNPGHSVDAKSVNFDGFSYVSFVNKSAYNVSAFTVSAWIRTSTVSAGQQILSNYDSTPSDRAFEFLVAGSKCRITVYVINTGVSTPVNLTSVSTVNNGVWHHVAASYDGNAIRLYVDGVLDNSTSETRPLSNVNPTLWIARKQNSGSPAFFNGDMSHVGFWSRALSDSEVSDLVTR